MVKLTIILFWLSLILIFYTYLGYGAFLKLLAIIKKKEVRKGRFTPFITVLISVYNGERDIREKLENTLSLEYPPDKMELIIVSDGSTDQTNEIVQEHVSQNVKLIILGKREGKEAAQKIGIQHSRGEIIVCTDVGATLDKNAITNLMRNFYDEKVGCVSGEDFVIPYEDSSVSTGERTYGNYELSVRRLESRVGTMIGVSGCFFAVRKELTNSWPTDVPSDFMVPLLVIRNGKRVISEPEAVCKMEAVESLSGEYNRKVRTLIRGMTTLFRQRDLLNPFSWGFVSIQLISHKLLRWLTPVLLIVLLITNYYLIHKDWFYRSLMVSQVICYMLTIIASFLGMMRINNKGVRVLSFYAMSNIATLVAWYRYILGDRKTIWEPSKR